MYLCVKEETNVHSRKSMQNGEFRSIQCDRVRVHRLVMVPALSKGDLTFRLDALLCIGISTIHPMPTHTLHSSFLNKFVSERENVKQIR